VVALDEMLPEVLELERTLPVVLALEDPFSAEVELTLDIPPDVPAFPGARADVVEAPVERPEVDVGVSRVVAGAALPAPAPEDEPAVCADDIAPVPAPDD
jgi:hypothetical protein